MEILTGSPGSPPTTYSITRCDTNTYSLAATDPNPTLPTRHGTY